MTSTYTTIQGDTWDMIAFKCYKNETYMTTLLEANPAHQEVVIFSAGVLLTVPEAIRPMPTDFPPWRAGDGS